MLIATCRPLMQESHNHPLKALRQDLLVLGCVTNSRWRATEAQVGEYLVSARAARARRRACPRSCIAIQKGHPLFMVAPWIT